MNILNQDEVSKYEEYLLIEKAIKYIELNYQDQPKLDEIAESMNISKYHFHRIFTRWAGISPNKFLQYITINHAKKILSEPKSILEATNEIGLSSTSRLYDLFVNFEAITPSEYRNSGEGLEIYYGCHITQFGECIIAITDRGICSLSFNDSDNKTEMLEEIKKNWEKSRFIESTERTSKVVEKIFKPTRRTSDNNNLKLLLKGTNFQVKVWEALLNIEFGKLVSYKDIALMIGQPTASRAVGTAIGKNPIAYIIPCHRVIREVGIINNYRWGTARKKAIIGWESSRLDEK